MKKRYSIIKGSGCYIPEKRVVNEDFLNNDFYDSEGNKINTPNEEIIKKFEKITEIKERRYVTDDLQTSDIAYFAAKDAIVNSGIDKESLDYIIVAHNFGDVLSNNRKSDLVPSLAARVKNKLGIENPGTISFDVPFGCPGWLMGMIQADYFLRSGDAKRALIIGAETLSRVSDPHDRDSMIYSDGAGATILEAIESDEPVGILVHSSRSDTLNHAFLLWMGKSNNPDYEGDQLFLKMHGRKLYEYALNTVPSVVKESLEKAKIELEQVDKVLIHQANAKMDDAILARLFKLFHKKDIPKDIMPMTIAELGNSSVATVPTLLNLLLNNKLPNQKVTSGNILVFASVGAGMNINSMIYKMP
ncbi:3-oxoacyl-ACP synthase III family protein [Prolixibacter sp. NT017]|uniref:3-oxoacyl-ACP synthase III family protein n=1 Tax=Prolixibacter sp. NT017 TaxID=2652390 RepID=UPI00126F309E|nr:ketoacyl-ACP synthase III [Prolixibacter sp. NT017]GET26483.1 3-oxoacyl-ACP synthase [Prolixibacter sp. NT017]